MMEKITIQPTWVSLATLPSLSTSWPQQNDGGFIPSTVRSDADSDPSPQLLTASSAAATWEIPSSANWVHIACCVPIFLSKCSCCAPCHFIDGTILRIHPAKTYQLPFIDTLTLKSSTWESEKTHGPCWRGSKGTDLGRGWKQIHQFGWVDSLVDNCRKSCNHYKDQLMLKIWEKCLSLCHIAHFPTSSSILDLFDMCGNGWVACQLFRLLSHSGLPIFKEPTQSTANAGKVKWWRCSKKLGVKVVGLYGWRASHLPPDLTIRSSKRYS